MINEIVKYIEKKQLKTSNTDCRVGDAVTVSIKSIENEKSKIQTFSGIVICLKNKGLRSSIKIRKLLGNEWVERTFLFHHPNIIAIKTIQKNYNRKAKLYFLNNTMRNIKKMTKGLK